eukprot:Platyproteum_vivax@DN14213_c0_g1_i1.p1
MPHFTKGKKGLQRPVAGAPTEEYQAEVLEASLQRKRTAEEEAIKAALATAAAIKEKAVLKAQEAYEADIASRPWWSRLWHYVKDLIWGHELAIPAAEGGPQVKKLSKKDLKKERRRSSATTTCGEAPMKLIWVKSPLESALGDIKSLWRKLWSHKDLHKGLYEGQIR